MNDSTKTPVKWRKWLLVGSVALNLAFIGVVAGSALKGHDSGRGKPPAQTDVFRDLVRAVPHSHRDALRSDLDAKQDEIRNFRQQARETRGELVRVLVSPDFDIEEVSTIFETNRAVLAKITRGGHEIILRRIENMTEAERHDFAENIRSYQGKRKKDR